MTNTSFGVRATLIASLILSGQAMAQNLPDEINHTQYLRVYQNLEQVLSQKISEFNKLNDQKIEIEKTIAQMQQDLVEIPRRNNDLRRILDQKRQESLRLDSEIQGLEGVLGKIIEDLRRLDNIIAQLQGDINQESSRAQTIAQRRNQVVQDVAQLNARLQREVQEENQSMQVLNKLTGEMNASMERRQEVDRERAQLIRDVDRFRTEIPQTRNALNQNNTTLASKKPLLTEAQSKFPLIKAELSVEESRLTQIDQILNPKRSQLNALKAELARLSPDIARLQNENKTLEQRISANEVKISSLNIGSLISRRDALEISVAPVKNEMKSNTDAQIALQEKIKPTIGQINDLTNQMREASRRRDLPEVARLKAEIDALNKTIEPDQREIQRLQRENDKLAISIAAKQNEINTLNTQISTAQTQITSLQNEINVSKVKIAENDKKILDLSQANSGLAQQIANLDAEVKALEAQRDPVAKKVTALKQQESQLAAQINLLTGEVQRLESEIQRLTARISEMEKTVAEYPQTLRRLEAHIRQLDEKVSELRIQVDREQRLLSRIRQDRIAIQTQRDGAQQVLNQINQDLMNSERLLGALRNKLNEEVRSREALARYNQDSVRKLDNLRVQKVNAEKEIANASQELQVNEQDLATISSELPKLRSELSTLTPQVAAAESARNTAQINASNANSQYQNRLALYNRYLADAQSLGAEKATIATADGAKVGAVEARAKANKLASDSASAEGKWEAIRRGYVRGEINGFRAGFDVGMASATDAQKGEDEGRIAGARRAKDHANMVIKPQKYLEELERRLMQDETSSAKPMMAMLINQELTNIKAMALQLNNNIPDLSSEEVAEASRIITSLDALIAQSDIEIKEILTLRRNLAQPRNVYTAPGAGENANKVDCTAVYKSVKDFVEACKGSYVIRYQNLYNTAHADTFNREYTPAFNAQIERVFSAELNRLYPAFFKEASQIGREAGIAIGKREIYQQSFNRAENASYGGNLPNEILRVETEAVNLVQEHLNQNSALTLKGSAKLSTNNIFGIAPGVDTELKMLIKNVGSQASQNNSLVRITELSPNLIAERREAPLAAVAGKSHADLSVLKLKVSETALPGQNAVIAGEIIHPGNHYRASRVEKFRIEKTLSVNPSVDSKVELDLTPKVSGILGVKKHEIAVSIRPKFGGVDRGYETVLEEVGSNFIEIIARPATTEILGRNIEKKVSFTYRLAKISRGKIVSLKVTVKNEGRIVSEQTVQIKPE